MKFFLNLYMIFMLTAVYSLQSEARHARKKTRSEVEVTNETSDQRDCLKDLPMKPSSHESNRTTVSYEHEKTYMPRFVNNLAACVIPITLKNNFSKELDLDKSPIDFQKLSQWLVNDIKIGEDVESSIEAIKEAKSLEQQSYSRQIYYPQSGGQPIFLPPTQILGPPVIPHTPSNNISKEDELQQEIEEVKLVGQTRAESIEYEEGLLQIIYTGISELPNNMGTIPYLCLSEIKDGKPLQPNCKYRVALVIVQHTDWYDDGVDRQILEQKKLINMEIANISMTDDKLSMLGRAMGMDKMSSHMSNMSGNMNEITTAIWQIAVSVKNLDEYVQKLSRHTSDLSNDVRRMADLVQYLGVNVSRMSVSVNGMQQQFTPMGMMKSMMPF